MSEFERETERRLEVLDESLFAPIESQSTPADRLAFLRLQRLVRRQGPYTYLEVGSHLGGSLQTHYIDSRCLRIVSLDTRPLWQPDARGWPQQYPGNSSARMRAALAAAYPAVDAGKLVVIEEDSARAGAVTVDPAPTLCFIDGEHTRRAAVSDFAFCRRVAAQDAMFVFHDADLVAPAIGQIQWRLWISGEHWRGFAMGTSVFVLVIGAGVDRFAGTLTAFGPTQRPAYWISTVRRLVRLRAHHHWPRLTARYARWRQGR